MRGLLAQPRYRDAGLAAALSLTLVLELALGAGGATPLRYVLGLATTAPLALRSRFPVIIGLGVQAVFAATALVLQPVELFSQAVAVFIVATYTAAVGARTWRESILCGLGSILLLGLQGAWDGRFGSVGAALANAVYGTLVWSVAAAVRVHASRSERARLEARAAAAGAELLAQDAVRSERSRVARELHDVVAHALSIIVLRARGGVHEEAAEPGAGTAALRDVQHVAERALADMRRLLALVEDPADLEPQPCLDDLPALLDQLAGSGVPVRFATDGTPQPISPGLSLSAYRVVQESLTNVLRHSGGGAADVRVSWQPGALELEIADDGPVDGTGPAVPGRGLLGLRDRVELFGGTFEAGPRGGRGFRVRARLPVAP